MIQVIRVLHHATTCTRPTVKYRKGNFKLIKHQAESKKKCWDRFAPKLLIILVNFCIHIFCIYQMSFNQPSSNSGYGSPNNYFFRCKQSSSSHNLESRKNDNEPRSYLQYSSIKGNDENNSMRKVKTCKKFSMNLEEMEKCTTVADSIIQIKDQYSTTPKEIAAKLIALADAFDKEFFGNLNISKK
uniref:Uncharacterized protein n=1 Tax=Onchocerca volvulus TaxID=6282 RepID=A0A8R1XUJ0_ONCVO